jgi:hypothetical protein
VDQASHGKQWKPTPPWNAQIAPHGLSFNGPRLAEVTIYTNLQ